MECQLFFLRMLRPHRGFGGLLFSLCSVHKPVYVTIRLYCSAHALCVDQLDQEASATVVEGKNCQIQLQEDLCKLPNEPRKYETSSVMKEVVRLDEEGIVISNINERRKKYSSMLHNCAFNKSLYEGKAVHGHVIKSGIEPDLHLWNSVVNVYAKCGSYQYARRVFDNMCDRDVVSWTVLISGFVDKGFVGEGMNTFCEMRKQGVRPNDCTLTTCLKVCYMCLDLELGKQLHAELIKTGVLSDVFVRSALINIYAKCHEMEQADKLFVCIPEKNVVLWNSMLNGWAQTGNVREVLRLFSSMAEFETKFSCFTLSTVLKGCAKSGNLREARAVHSLAIKVGCELDEYVSCCLLDLYSKFKFVDDALKIFKRIKDPKVVAWSTMINCLDQQGRSQEAAELFRLMRRSCLVPNEFTLSSLISVATNLGEQRYGESIHAFICKYGYLSDSFVSTTLITFYMKIGSFQQGCEVFKAISHCDTASWNALLFGFNDNEASNQGPRIFCDMLIQGVKPDLYTFVGILGCCSSLSNVNFGKQVHTHIVKHGLDGKNSSTGTALVNMYAKSGSLEDADAVFSRLQETDLFAWTAMISNSAHTGQGEKAFKYLNEMQQEGTKPNAFTLSSCLSVSSNLAILENGQQLHSLAMKSGLCWNTYIASALVDMYSKCRRIEDAESVFNGMFERNTVAWNTIIYAYSQHGKGDKALEAFRLMMYEGARPDEITFIGVLSACSHMGLIEEGKKHFNSMSKVYKITPTIEHHASMVNILCRAGEFSEAENFIETMELTRNTLIWEVVLWASKMHGNVEFGKKASEKLFELDVRKDYDYISLSDIFAAKGRWEDVAKVRAIMQIEGIKKEPACSCVEVDAHSHKFFAQDGSQPKIRDICKQLGELIS